MAGSYYGGKSGSSGYYKSGSLPSPKKKKQGKKGRSFGGFAGNLAGEVGALAGIPMGIASLGKNLATDPLDTGAALGKAAWKSHIATEFKTAFTTKPKGGVFTKAGRKDLGEDLSFVYEHPLQSVLDVTLVGGVAVSAAARLGRVAKVESLTKASTPRPVVLKDPTGRGRPDVELRTSGKKFVSPMRQGRKHLTHELMPARMKAARYERHRVIRDRRDLTTVENAWTAMFAAAKAITEKGPVRQAKQAAIVKDMHRVYTGIGNEFDTPAAKPKDYDWIQRPTGPHMVKAKAGHAFVETKPGSGTFKEVKDPGRLPTHKVLQASKSGAFIQRGNSVRIISVAGAKPRKIPKELDEAGLEGDELVEALELRAAQRSGKGAKVTIEPDGTYSVSHGFKEGGGVQRLEAPKGKVYQQTKPGRFKLVDEAKSKPIGPDVLRSGEGHVLRKSGKNSWRKEQGVGLESDYTPAAFEAALMGGTIRADVHDQGPGRGGGRAERQAPGRAQEGRGQLHQGGRRLPSVADGPGGEHHAPLAGARAGHPSIRVQQRRRRHQHHAAQQPFGIQVLRQGCGRRTRQGQGAKAPELRTPARGVSWIDAAFGHVRGHGFVREVPKFKVGGKKGKVLDIERRWYDFVNRWSEESYRVSALMQRVRNDPQIKQMQKQGLSEHDAVMAKATQDRQWTHQVSDEIDDMFGQYYYHNKLERNVRSLGVPFYGWYRAISRSTTNTFKDRPGRALGMMALGEYGIEETKAALGEIPEFMRGVVPLGGFLEGTPQDGRVSILSTAGMNPWNTPAELMRGVASLMGGGGRTSETLGSMFGPVPATVIESLTGRDLLTDVPTKKNALGVAIENFGLNPERGSLPQIQLGQFIGEMTGLREDVPGTYDKSDGGTAERLYDPNAFNTLLGLHGFPRKYVSKSAAKKRKKQEDPY